MPVPSDMTDAERNAMVAVARAHVAAERVADVDATMATLDDDPTYELQPMNVVLRGRSVARRYYEHFFAICRPRIRRSELRSEWITDRGVLHEYVLHVDEPDGTTTRHHLVAVLEFGAGRLSGERLYAGDALLRMMFGPVLDNAGRR
jgi:hypothetical protein